MSRTNGMPVISPIRSDRWNEADRVHRAMDDIFGRTFGYTPLSRLIPTTPRAEVHNEVALSADVYETDEALTFVVPVPGYAPIDIHIEAASDHLVISGERKPLFTDDKASHRLRGRLSTEPASFKVSYALPVEIDVNGVRANYRNGVLELTLPKVQPDKPVSVKVTVNTDGEKNA